MKAIRTDNPVIRLPRQNREDLVFLGSHLAECSQCWETPKRELEQLTLSLYRTSIGKFVLSSHYLIWKRNHLVEIHRAICFSTLEDVCIFLEGERDHLGLMVDRLMDEALPGNQILINARAS